MPANRRIQFAHTLFHRRALDEPRVQGIIEYGLVSTPAMGIVVNMLLNLEHLILCLQIHANRNVERFVFICQRLVVSVLYITPCKFVPFIDIHIVLDEVFVEILDDEVFTLQVDHRTLGALLVYQDNGTDACFLGNKSIVCTEVWSNMHDTRTIVGCNIIAGDHLEGISHRLDGGHQLFIFHTDKIGSLVTAYDAIRNELFASIVFRHLATVSNSTLDRQIGIQTCFSQYQRHLVGCVRIICLNSHIVNLRAYAKGRVGSKRPRCSRPGEEIRSTPLCHLGFWVLHLELCRTSRILHITIATWLVQLV